MPNKTGPIGAAWYRIFTEVTHGHGFVAEDVPELAIAVIASRRHEGIGRRLLVDLIEASVAQGYPAISLSVAEAIRHVAILIRAARAEDASAVTRLLAQLGYDLTPSVVGERLTNLVSRSQVPVAESTGSVLGVVADSVQSVLHLISPLAAIETLVVDDSARSAGLAFLGHSGD